MQVPTSRRLQTGAHEIGVSIKNVKDQSFVGRSRFAALGGAMDRFRAFRHATSLGSASTSVYPEHVEAGLVPMARTTWERLLKSLPGEYEARFLAAHVLSQRGLRLRSALLVWLLIICFDVYFATVNHQVRARARAAPAGTSCAVRLHAGLLRARASSSLLRI